MASSSQVNRKNEKKRTRDFRKNLELYQATGKRIILKKPPNQDMIIAAEAVGLDAYDLCAETLSPAEKERRRQEYNTYQRGVSKRNAIKNNGVYKGTGAQDKKLTKKEEYEKDYFELKPEEQIAAHEAKQLVRDITRGWACPICKGIMPDVIDITEEDIVNYVQVRKGKDKEFLFFFHVDCYNTYKDKKDRSVHQMNTSKELIENYANWQRAGDKI